MIYFNDFRVVEYDYQLNLGRRIKRSARFPGVTDLWKLRGAKTHLEFVNALLALSNHCIEAVEYLESIPGGRDSWSIQTD